MFFRLHSDLTFQQRCGGTKKQTLHCLFLGKVESSPPRIKIGCFHDTWTDIHDSLAGIGASQKDEQGLVSDVSLSLNSAKYYRDTSKKTTYHVMHD